MSPTRKIVLPEPVERLVKDVPERHPDVRSLARFAANSECSLASVGFAAAVDFDHLLDGTPFQPPFGQSPFTFGRGENFENLLRAKGYEPLRTVIGDALSGTARPNQAVNLRFKFPPTRAGTAERAKATRELVARVLQGDSGAPRLIDGAVLQRETRHRQACIVVGRAGDRKLVEGIPPATPTYVGWDRRPALDGWYVHEAVFHALERVRFS